VHIEWPEERCGLAKDALAKVRKAILWMNFVCVPIPCPYNSPEAFGETEETLRKRNQELWAKDFEYDEPLVTMNWEELKAFKRNEK